VSAEKFDEAPPHELGATAIEIAVYGYWMMPTSYLASTVAQHAAAPPRSTDCATVTAAETAK